MKRSIVIAMIAMLAGAAACADSLFSAKTAEEGSLVSNKKPRYNIGDIITVIVDEKIDASTQADTSTSKESELSAEAPVASNTFLVAKGPGGLNIVPQERLPSWDIQVENDHQAKGKTQRKNKLSMVVTCQVTKIHPNGNIDIEGEKQVTVNREDSRLAVSGTVRGSDVSPENTINSSKLANAVVELRGRGPLWNNQRRGLLTKLLDWFSPF